MTLLDTKWVRQGMDGKSTQSCLFVTLWDAVLYWNQLEVRQPPRLMMCLVAAIDGLNKLHNCTGPRAIGGPLTQQCPLIYFSFNKYM